MSAAERPRPTRRDIFGSVRLGYVVVDSQRLTEWNRFGADAIGLHVDALDRDHLRFRIDERECRFLIQRGGAEDVVGAGWEVDDHETFEEILKRVHAAGLPVTEGTTEETALRGVERLWRFPGPKGIATEVFTRPLTTTAALRMQNSEFVTGRCGMGHMAITTRHPEQLHTYWNNLLDLRLTDRITERMGPALLRVRFLRAGERHHSIALGNIAGLPIDPIRTSVQHVNIQVNRLEDMLAAYHRVRDLGFAMAWTVGQHTNDRELSFYCVTPSGFEHAEVLEQALAVVAGLVPVTLLVTVLRQTLAPSLPLIIQVTLTSTINVAILTWLVMPVINRLLHTWLTR